MKFKYNSKDYPEIQDFIDNYEKAYNEYIKNKTLLSKGYLVEATHNIKLGIKHLLIMGKITEQVAEDMLNYYMEITYA